MRSRRGVLGCAALLLVFLAAVFPLAPALGSSAQAMRLLARSKERHRRLEADLAAPERLHYNARR